MGKMEGRKDALSYNSKNGKKKGINRKRKKTSLQTERSRSITAWVLFCVNTFEWDFYTAVDSLMVLFICVLNTQRWLHCDTQGSMQTELSWDFKRGLTRPLKREEQLHLQDLLGNDFLKNNQLRFLMLQMDCILVLWFLVLRIQRVPSQPLHLTALFIAKG